MRLITAPLMAGLLVAGVMGAKEYAPFWPVVAFMEGGLLYLAGVIAGVRLPDLDLLLAGISHRSGITHSCLAPTLCLWFASVPVAGGMALGMALHMASDMQPKAWTGGATIKFPILGGIGWLSPLWLIGSVVGCVAVLLQVLTVASINDRQLMLLVSTFSFIWYFCREERKPLLPLLTVGFSIMLVHSVRSGAWSIESLARYFGWFF